MLLKNIKQLGTDKIDFCLYLTNCSNIEVVSMTVKLWILETGHITTNCDFFITSVTTKSRECFHLSYISSCCTCGPNTFLITLYKKNGEIVWKCAIFYHQLVILPLAKWDQCISMWVGGYGLPLIPLRMWPQTPKYRRHVEPLTKREQLQ